MDNTIYFSNFAGADFFSRMSQAMDEAKKVPGTTLVIEPGEYVLTSELAKKVQNECISGTYGTNPESRMFRSYFEYFRGIDFTGHKGTKILADGVKLMIDGFMEPLSVRDCEDVIIEGLTIDYVRRPYSVGTVIRSTNIDDETAHIDVELEAGSDVCAKTPVNIRNLYYNAQNNRLETLPMDGAKGEVLSNNIVRYTGRGLRKNIVGSRVYLWHAGNFRPAILMERGADLTVRNVTVHSQPGMGITANNCENILLDGFSVVPPEGMHVSVNTDAAHFTACRGEIKIINSIFESQGGSAVNVHNYYHAVLIVDGNRNTVRMEAPSGTHTNTPDYPRMGDIMEASLFSSLETVGTRRVIDYSVRPGTYVSDITLDIPLPIDSLERGIQITNVSALPKFRFENNRCLGNFGHALIINTRDAVVVNNVFEDVMSSPVYICPNAPAAQSVAAADVTVDSNVMRRCGHSAVSQGIGGVDITLNAEMPTAIPQLRNIKIVNNTVDCPGTGVAFRINNVDGLEFSDNVNVSSIRTITMENCSNVTVRN